MSRGIRREGPEKAYRQSPGESQKTDMYLRCAGRRIMDAAYIVECRRREAHAVMEREFQPIQYIQGKCYR